MGALPWATCFVDPDDVGRPAQLRLRQVTATLFTLESSLRYTGPTGIDLPDELRTVRPSDLGTDGLTDLASVPSALRWFVGPYGLHTPAALVHDRLVGAPCGVAAPDADRLFRFMLKELGVRFVRRWMMWAAVTFGTRWRTGGLPFVLVVVWSLLALFGLGVATVALAHGDLPLLIGAVVAPVLASGLWGRQAGAGLVAALVAVWVLPPTVVGAVGFGVYWVLEKLVGLLPLSRRVSGEEPVSYKRF